MREMIGPKTGKKYVVHSISELCQAIERDDCTGFCIHCGFEQSGVEPDAQKYECEACERRGVYGAEQLVLMGVYYTPKT